MSNIRYTGYFPGVIGYLAGLQANYYQEKSGLKASYELQQAREMCDFIEAFDAKLDGAWIALNGEQDRIDHIVGSMFADGHTHKHENAVRLRWFIVHERARGQGIGKELILKSIDFAEQNGFDEVFLWTVKGLTKARELYDWLGFEVAEEYANSDWGNEVLHQKLSKRLK
jgi:GNAT superfamily N-acetyltransferase